MIWPSDDLHFLEHRFEALFELAAELRAGDQRAHVERDHALVLQAFGHVAAHDAAGQAFHDGGLADARLADQHRIVLGAARKHLDHAADLFVAADHRIELALRGELRQIAAVFFERFVGGFRILSGDALAAADLLQSPHQALARDAEFAEQFSRGARIFGGGQQHVLHGNVFVLQALGFLFGLREQLGDAVGDVDLIGATGRTGYLGQPVDLLLEPAAEGVHPNVGLVEDGGGKPAFLLEQGQHQVFGVDLLVSVLNGDGLGGADGLLQFFGESVEVHSGASPS